MNATLIIAVALVILIVVAVVTKRVRLEQRSKRQATGIYWLQSLRVLLSHVQQHRGLTTGYLGGDKSLEPKIFQLQRSVSQDVKSITKSDPWMEDNERWKNITQHWARLAGKYQEHTKENNLNQHNKLIQSILYLIDEMAEEHDLLLVKSKNGKPLHFIWRELLMASECIGQARAIGSGVVAAMECDSVSRIRLNYLSEKIKESTDLVWSEIPPSTEQRERLNTLLTSINTRVVVDVPDIMVATFFEIATKALDSLHQQYDEVLDNLTLNNKN